MTHRSNHYDAAVEEYLRHSRVPYVAVDEAKRALFAEASLKSLDFIVYSRREPNLLIDFKGRRFPSGKRQQRGWENWTTRDDIESLRRWQHVFGRDFQSVLLFAYNLLTPSSRETFPWAFEYRDRAYAFLAIGLEEYAAGMKARSPRWATVSMPVLGFRQLARPLADWL